MDPHPDPLPRAGEGDLRAGGPIWSTACLDWEERIVGRRSLVPFAPLFPEEAEAALGVFKALRVVDLPGKPAAGEVFDEEVFSFVGAIFGAYDPVSARRLIREFMLLISKKNFKSTIAALVMLTALIRNWRSYAELLILAPTIEVANNSFGPAAGAVAADEELSDLIHVIEHQRTIRHRVTQAELKIVAADSDVAAGKKAGFVLVEELWLFGKKPAAAAMLREATGGLAARPEGFVVYLTTHSDEPPRGVFKEKLDYFREVRDGVVSDPTRLGVLYEWPQALLEAEAYLDPDYFYVTNPNLARTVGGREWLETELALALRGEGEGKQLFLAKHLNVEIGLRLSRDRWRGAELWEGAGDRTLTLDALLERSEVVVATADGGGLDDLFGLCVAGRERATKRWLFWFHAWAVRDVLRLRKEIAPALLDFEADGDLTIVDRAHEIITGVTELIGRVARSGLMPKKGAVGVDPYGIGALVDALDEIGLVAGEPHYNVVPVSQGSKLSSATWSFEWRLNDGMMVHSASRMMAFCVGNAKAEQRGDAVLITKEQSGKGKIDPFIAGLMAGKLLEGNPVASNANGGLNAWLASLKAPLAAGAQAAA